MRGDDIVSNEWGEDEIRRRYDETTATEIIAFRRFLNLPRDGQGRAMCPPHWYAYGKGEIDSATVLAHDEAKAVS